MIWIVDGNGQLDRKAAVLSITLELERTLEQDMACGLRLSWTSPSDRSPAASSHADVSGMG